MQIMATFEDLNISSHLNITPSRKRKRQFELEENAIKTTAPISCFTNAAFSSTPKKILAKRRILARINTENEKIYPNVIETKSIEEIDVNQGETLKVSNNPYEVLRKPPKKKKRHMEEIACFENCALNLEVPDKLFNPYEVVREVGSIKNANCFSNPGLNLKVQDASILCNPFEVQRVLPIRNIGGDAEVHSESLKSSVIPSEVHSLQWQLTRKPCEFKLGVPFIPKVGCRIDFNGISIPQITPTKLLAEKLVFSPGAKPKISLGSTGDESTMDIGKELDRYQLELENSINEAKLHKTGATMVDILVSPPEATSENQILEKKAKFTQKLCGISEDSESEQSVVETNKHNEQVIKLHVQDNKNLSNTNPFQCDQPYERTETAEVVEIENNELFCCSADELEDDDSFDFKTPAEPFVRAYRKSDIPSRKITASKECLESNICKKSPKKEDQSKKSSTVKSILRKFVQPHQNGHQQQLMTEEDSDEKREYNKNNGFINAIRQSLRRKTARNLDEDNGTKENEISIIDSTERTMKLKSDLLQTEYIKVEDLTNERKHNLRNSIRKSTREVRNHFLKSIFHKKYEDYDCHK